MRTKSTSSPTVTITVACIATAMLMLDISVINTALSAIADGLKTGLGGLQWVIDAYALPLAATVLTADSGALLGHQNAPLPSAGRLPCSTRKGGSPSQIGKRQVGERKQCHDASEPVVDDCCGVAG